MLGTPAQGLLQPQSKGDRAPGEDWQECREVLALCAPLGAGASLPLTLWISCSDSMGDVGWGGGWLLSCVHFENIPREF